MTRAQDYRLRSFEVAYVKPRLQFFDDRRLRANAWYERPVDPTGEVDLQMMLLREAANWIDMGRWCGYFSGYLTPDQIQFGGRDIRDIYPWYQHLDPRRQDVVSYDWRFRTEPPEGLVEHFGESLRTAMDDLTDDRLEFLRVFLFTTDAEWEFRTAELNLLVKALAAGYEHFDEQFVDSLTWAFHGPQSDLRPQQQRLPSDWRADPLYDLRARESRRVTLESFRGMIEAFVTPILQSDALRRPVSEIDVRRNEELVDDEYVKITEVKR